MPPNAPCQYEQLHWPRYNSYLACSVKSPSTGSPAAAASSVSCKRRLTDIIREYISSASGYFTLKLRQ